MEKQQGKLIGESDAAMADQARSPITLRKSGPAWKALLDKTALEAEGHCTPAPGTSKWTQTPANGWQGQQYGGLWGTDWFGQAQTAVI